MKKKISAWRERSPYGVVSVYTPRHVGECMLRDRNDSSCSCPKWIYARARGGKATQMAAKTPSFAEAVTKAQQILRGYDPEIAKAREKNNPTAAAEISIEECLRLYEAALGRRAVTPLHIKHSMLLFNRRKQKNHGRALNLSFLDFLDGENGAAREPVVRMSQITSNILDKWSAGWKTNDLTSRSWRGKVGAFLKWSQAHDHIERLPVFREKQKVRAGNRTGHFTDSQIAKMYAGLPFVEWKFHNKPENFEARLGAFIDLGRHAGLAVVDIVHFEPKVSLSRDNVITYRVPAPDRDRSS